jgi:hypothetical protein
MARRIEIMAANTPEPAKQLKDVLMPGKTAKPRRPVKRLEDVLMPGKFIDSIDRFVNSLYGPIVKGAFLRAFVRKTGTDAGYVTPEDLFESAKAVLGTAMADFPQELAPGEKRHARRKSA